MVDNVQTQANAIDSDRLLQLVTAQENELAAFRAFLAEREQMLDALRAEVRYLSQQSAQAALADGEAGVTPLAPPQLLLAMLLHDTAYDALLAFDDEMRLLASNAGARTLFGRDFVQGERLAEYTASPELEMLVLDALAYQEDSFEDQLTLDKRTYRTRLNTVRRDGQVYIGLALQDVTDVVHLKRARREMVANISHELRTPIANIRLIIDSLFHEGDKPKGKASRGAIKDIARETDSLLWLVQELWDLSMIESGDAILRAIELPLLPLVQEAIERMEDQGSAKDLRIRHDMPSDLNVLADRDQIRRVVMNLIHNAIKHSPPGGAITVSAERSGLDAIISVVDEGPGVPEEHVDRIFERFYQVDPARARGMGTGLGLAICKHIVEAHSGRIWAVGNQDGGGGRFYFTLPLEDYTSG